MTSILDFDKKEMVAALRAQRAETLAVLEDLTETQWSTEIVPRWRTREVAAHLVSTDQASVNGTYLTWGFRPRPMSSIEEWNDHAVAKWADRPVPELLRALDKYGRRFARLLSLPPRRLSNLALPTPFGKVSTAWLGMLRVYDEWVHVEDIRRALSLPTDDSSERLRPAATFLLAGIPIQTLPDVPAGAGGTVEIGFTDVEAPKLGIDLGTRRFGVGLSSDAQISGSAASLIMVAAGRDRWRETEEAGRLDITGDRKAAEALLDVLRVV
jgi:uncharacterized protein (TIGR03083 family)